MADNKSGLWKWSIVLLLLSGGLIGGWKYYRQTVKEPLPDYRTVDAAIGDIVQSVTANGGLSAVKNVAVGSQISGTIKEIRADFNSRVKMGEIIAQIDPATYEQNVDQADAELASARASLELADLNNKRATALLKNALIAPAEADKTIADLHQAQAVVRMREASVKKAKVDLERTTIYAPISGMVISRNVDVGQTVAASFSTPTLFQIANDLTKMQIDAMVSEADVGGVEESQPVEFTVDAFPGRQFQGVVKQVRFAPTTNQNVVTYTTVVEVNNDDLKLRPGMTVNASIIIAKRSNVLRIPNAALRFRPVENSSKTNKTAVAKGGGSNRTATAAMTGDGSKPGSGSASPDERRRRFEQMSPGEREAFRERMRARGGEGGPPGASGARRSGRELSTRTVYVLKKSGPSIAKETVVLEPVTVKLGVSDGAYTEVLEGLKEGDAIVAGVNPPAGTKSASAQPAANPFGGSPFGGGGFRGPR